VPRGGRRLSRIHTLITESTPEAEWEGP
jgi:hypothetical protein